VLIDALDVLDALGGSITVDSTVGGGTTFHRPPPRSGPEVD
jgi:hypothetical protein